MPPPVRKPWLLYHPPMRVVSLVPSATEILCAVGGESLLVGRSHECDFPPSILDRPVLTRARIAPGSGLEIDRRVREALAANQSLYELDEGLLRSLRPDLVLTQDLCAVCSIDLPAVRRIAENLIPKAAILSLNPSSLEDVFDDILRVGEAIGRPAPARETIVRLRDRYWSAVDYMTPYTDGPETAILEWLDPLFIAGHWTPGMLLNAGARSSLARPGEKSRQIAPRDLVDAAPQRLIIAPCGMSLDATRAELPALISQSWWRELPAVAQQNVMLVDGNQMFSRPGPRLIDAFCWLVGWINNRPELIPTGFPAESLETAASLAPNCRSGR
jgi:iron complex transport system substrate-binding protein